MKKNIITPFAFLSLVLVAIFSGCESEYFEPVNISATDTISFSTDLQPILTTKCLGGSCHEGSVPPNLSEGKAYSSLTNGGFVDTLNPDQSILYKRIIKGGGMPPSGELPGGDIQKFLLWIQQGAKEN